MEVNGKMKTIKEKINNAKSSGVEFHNYNSGLQTAINLIEIEEHDFDFIRVPKIMKMNAKEMFEKLNYKQVVNCDKGITYAEDYYIRVNIVKFNFENKTFILDYAERFKFNNSWFEVNIELFQAITQQMKELGWI